RLMTDTQMPARGSADAGTFAIADGATSCGGRERHRGTSGSFRLMGKPFVKGDPRAGRKPGSKVRLTNTFLNDVLGRVGERRQGRASHFQDREPGQVLCDGRELSAEGSFARNHDLGAFRR